MYNVHVLGYKSKRFLCQACDPPSCLWLSSCPSYLQIPPNSHAAYRSNISHRKKSMRRCWISLCPVLYYDTLLLSTMVSVSVRAICHPRRCAISDILLRVKVWWVAFHLHILRFLRDNSLLVHSDQPPGAALAPQLIIFCWGYKYSWRKLCVLKPPLRGASWGELRRRTLVLTGYESGLEWFEWIDLNLKGLKWTLQKADISSSVDSLSSNQLWHCVQSMVTIPPSLGFFISPFYFLSHHSVLEPA